ncbi:hypothetical protein NW755_006093 [Fusarium falciforme]|uniref:C2H2-type domain-containing protein n=1 Tax=Fusarium falciforme TaxID=195108 RepID=A0A9W8V1T1_9HYPO|nr:hypothetical protein NW755_006093 [Fusarium falciforme]
MFDSGFDWASLFPDDLLQPAPDLLHNSTSPSSQGTKRRRDDPEEGESSVHLLGERKRSRSRVDIFFSCPYRRRNPRVFNVRDFPTCAHHSFSSITLVKRHVTSAHQAKDFTFQCKTCSTWFPTKKAVDNHCNRQTCSRLPLLVVDEYDRGITEEMESKLRDRRGKNKVLEWEGLWRTIFPTSQGIAAPDFVPIIEHDEGRERFYQGLSELEPSMILEVRGILFKALDLHPVEVVRELDGLVKVLSSPAQRMLNSESEAIPDEDSVTLSWETTPSAL